MPKPIICLDFDGVIHDYKRGWQDGQIYGEVVPGFFEWAEDAGRFFTLCIYSSRSTTLEGRAKMREWVEQKARDSGAEDLVFTYSATKPPAFLTIDDRAICFNGDWFDWNLQPDILRQFKPWNAPR